MSFATGFLFLMFSGAYRSLSLLAIKPFLVIIYIAIVPTLIVTLIWYTSFKVIGIVNAASFKLLIPLFGTILSVLFLKEQPTSYMLFGMIFIIAGIAFIQRT